MNRTEVQLWLRYSGPSSFRCQKKCIFSNWVTFDEDNNHLYHDGWNEASSFGKQKVWPSRKVKIFPVCGFLSFRHLCGERKMFQKNYWGIPSSSKMLTETLMSERVVFKRQDKSFENAVFRDFSLSSLRCEKPNAKIELSVRFVIILKMWLMFWWMKWCSLWFLRTESLFFKKNQTTSTLWLYRSIKLAMQGFFQEHHHWTTFCR